MKSCRHPALVEGAADRLRFFQAFWIVSEPTGHSVKDLPLHCVSGSSLTPPAVLGREQVSLKKLRNQASYVEGFLERGSG